MVIFTVMKKIFFFFICVFAALTISAQDFVYTEATELTITGKVFPDTHPGVPLIFIRTIRRENRNFNTAREKYEAEKMAVADSIRKPLVKILRKYGLRQLCSGRCPYDLPSEPVFRFFLKIQLLQHLQGADVEGDFQVCGKIAQQRLRNGAPAGAV